MHPAQPVRVGVLLLKVVELFDALVWLLLAQAHATQELLDPSPSASSLSRTKLLIVTAHRHKTSDTHTMCSLSRVMSAGDRSRTARGALRFQRYGVFGLNPSNIPRHERWTSHKHRCMSHCRSVLHWWDLSMNQSHTTGSAWTLRRFAVLPLGSSSTGAAARRTRSAGMGDLLVCERSGDGVSWLPPAWTLLADTMRKLMVVENVLLERDPRQRRRPRFFENLLPRRCAHRAGSNTRIPESDFVLFPQKQTCLTTVYETRGPMIGIGRVQIHPCCRLHFSQASHSLFSVQIHPCCRTAL